GDRIGAALKGARHGVGADAPADIPVVDVGAGAPLGLLHLGHDGEQRSIVEIEEGAGLFAVSWCRSGRVFRAMRAAGATDREKGERQEAGVKRRPSQAVEAAPDARRADDASPAGFGGGATTQTGPDRPSGDRAR